MSRTGRILSPCHIAALALVLLLAACPSGVTFKRAGPCGRALCECDVPAQDPGANASLCCQMHFQAARMNFDGPAARNAAPRLALEEAFPPCTPGRPAECALLGSEDAFVVAVFAAARPEPSAEIPTPPPRS